MVPTKFKKFAKINAREMSKFTDCEIRENNIKGHAHSTYAKISRFFDPPCTQKNNRKAQFKQ